jgi:nucleotide-binding universal stress UspA family protein
VEVHLLTVNKLGASHETVSSHDYSHSLTPAGTLSGQTLSAQEPIPALAEDRTQSLVRLRTEAEERLAALAAEFLPLIGASVHVDTNDDVPTTIIDQAQSLGVDIIVVGTHGRTGLRHLLMGSVAEAIVRQSPVPVLVVGPRVGAD